MNRLKLISVLAFLLLCTAGVLGWHMSGRIMQPINLGERQLTVRPGTGIVRFARQLTESGVIDSVLIVRLAYHAHQMFGTGGQLQAGTYTFADTSTLYDLLGKVIAGKVVQKTFTIIPGWNKQQLLDALATERVLCDVSPPLDAQKRATIEAALIAEFAPQRTSIEGLFLADSYRYTKECDLSPLRLARAALVDALSTLWQGRDTTLPLDAPYQALTLASIIEKETGVASERPVIAAVFINRLNKRIRLQTDPTVIYGLGNAYKGNITSAHLRQKTPYNTYVIRGLPPTPISMVSLAALQSVFIPKDTDYLYFVGKGDGSHHFSRTYVEHRKAVKRYQIHARRRNYRSSPQNNSSL